MPKEYPGYPEYVIITRLNSEDFFQHQLSYLNIKKSPKEKIQLLGIQPYYNASKTGDEDNEQMLFDTWVQRLAPLVHTLDQSLWYNFESDC